MRALTSPGDNPPLPAAEASSTTPMGLRPPRYRADRRAIGWWAVQSAIFIVPAVPVLVLLGLLIPPARFWLLTPATMLAVLDAVYLVVMPRWKFRVHRWEVTEDAVYTASGWLRQTWRVAPMSRIQTVDAVRGPIQQLFGLSSVTVTTASAAGAVRITGLDHRVATDLVHRLTAVTQATPGDAT